jgi:hypothetical protein
MYLKVKIFIFPIKFLVSGGHGSLGAVVPSLAARTDPGSARGGSKSNRPGPATTATTKKRFTRKTASWKFAQVGANKCKTLGKNVRPMLVIVSTVIVHENLGRWLPTSLKCWGKVKKMINWYELIDLLSRTN